MRGLGPLLVAVLAVGLAPEVERYRLAADLASEIADRETRLAHGDRTAIPPIPRVDRW